MCEVVCLFMFVSLLLVVIYLLERVNCKRLHDTTVVVGLNLAESKGKSTSDIMSEKGREMEKGVELVRGSPSKGESSFSSGETDPLKAPLSILVKVTKVNGESLPYGEVSTGLVEEIFQNSVGIVPLDVLILNDQDALVDLIEGTAVTEIAMAVHGEGRWRDQDIRVGCVIAGRESLISIEKEREEHRMQREELERDRQELLERERESRMTVQEESLRIKNEFANYQLHMNDLTSRVQEQLSLLETVCKDFEDEVQRKKRRSSLKYPDDRIDKLPVFPLFSGVEPTPKDECGIETFLFQVRGARKNLTDQAV